MLSAAKHLVLAEILRRGYAPAQKDTP